MEMLHSAGIDRELLQAALEGLESRLADTNEKIAEVKKRLRIGGPVALPAAGAVVGAKPKRKVSAAARRRMSAAQKKRWAKIEAKPAPAKGRKPAEAKSGE